MLDLLEEKVSYISCRGISWKAKQQSEREAKFLADKLSISSLASSILASRIDIDSVEDFLNPTLKAMLPNPFSMLDMQKAVHRVYDAMNRGEKIGVIGDYDVDGATSSALLVRYFRDLNKQINVYIPDRLQEGYGPSIQAFDYFISEKISVVLIVDSGTVAFDPLKYAKDNGVDVIVIDHHMGLEKLPESIAVINPNRLDETFPHKNLAAVGVTFLFLVACNIYFRQQNYFENSTEPNLMQLLDLVALGTVCDVMKLTGLNRAFVTQGLKLIKKRQNLGIKTLLDVAGNDTAPTVYHLGFVIGPRINAGGRVGESALGYQILSSDAEMQVLALAKKLDLYNKERKAIEESILELAMEQAEKIDDFIITVVGDNWHPGVIGIIASRIKEKFYRPAIVISVNDGVATASCRSVNGFDLGALVVRAKMQKIIIEGGGHKMAAGFKIAPDRIADLKNFFREAIQLSETEKQDLRCKYYDLAIGLSAVNLDNIKEIELLQPYGNGNPQPRFILKNISISKVRILKDVHIACLLNDDIRAGKYIQAICFNAVGSEIGDVLLNHGRAVNIIATVNINAWQGKESAQILIEDIIVNS